MQLQTINSKLCSASNQPLSTGAQEALTPREWDVLTLLSRGFSNKKIALTLEISHYTVADYLKQIYQKLGVNNRVSASQYFFLQQATQAYRVKLPA